ncbi:MAG: hypothetical protein M3O35_08475 [Acidobacteriota bacterium]|nr:hypothetical protein [Acidobacteriota bacterium]
MHAPARLSRFLHAIGTTFTRPVAPDGPDWRIAAALFLLSLFLVQWQIGDRLLLSMDEGIYLEGALRVSQGQAPYRDFFTFTGPGAFWSYGAMLHLFGPTLSSARLLLAVEIAAMGGAVYWLTAVLAGTGLAASLGVLFVAFCLDSPGSLYICHRWDSNTWALVALVLACNGLAKARRAYWIASGACAAIAAWMTPPFVIVVAIIFAWIAWRRWWRTLGDYGVGVAAPSIAAVSVLLYQRAFTAMIQQLLWGVAHYGASNRVPYGYVPGNPLANFQGVNILHALLRTGWLIEVLMPAVLPVMAYVGLVMLLCRRRKYPDRKKEVIILLVAFSAGVILASLPRLDVHQLLFLSPVFWILCGYVFFEALGSRWRWHLNATLVLVSLLMLISSIRQDRRFTEMVETNAGRVRCTPDLAQLVSALESTIRPGDGLFVFPYLPILYFVTGGRNPSRLSFLQPGMMTDREEASVVAELRAHPPHWMLWAQFPPSLWTDNWPHINIARLEFQSLDAFYQTNYQETLRIKLSGEPQLVLACATPCSVADRH